MRRSWSYPTEFLFSRTELNALQAWRESGHLQPDCIKCGEPVRLKNDCAPVCADCAFRLPPIHGYPADEQERWMEAYRERARKRPAGRPTPSCWELFAAPLTVLADSTRLPDHVCEFVMRATTLQWANLNLLPFRNHPIPQDPNADADADAPDWDFWQLRWPLPVGQQAIEAELLPFESRTAPKEAANRDYVELASSLLAPEQQFLAAALAQHAADTTHELMCRSTAAAGRALIPRAPFTGDQRAMLALRVEIEGTGLVDIFGLGTMPAGGLDVFLGPLEGRWADGTPVTSEQWQHPVLRNARLLWRRVRRERERERPGPKPYAIDELVQAVKKQRDQSGKPRYRPSMRELETLTNGARTKSTLYALLKRNKFGGTGAFYDWIDSQ